MRFRKLMKHILTWGIAISVVGCGLPAAQAASSGDRDRDGIPDAWEEHGYDADGDGVVDVDLPAMGASPHHKDLFVEMDYMPGLLPPQHELDLIVESFAEIPMINPDGSRGIAIHLDAGPARGDAYDLGGGNEIPHNDLPRGMFDVTRYRQSESDPNRRGIFHYMIWGDSYGGQGSSGISWVNGMEFLVTVGPRFWGRASEGARVGTFIHELGHNLGLGHGGSDDINGKPQYLSVMNYRYQVSGVPRMNNSRYYGYSTRTMRPLDENALIESEGFGPSTAGYAYEYRGTNGYQKVAANGPIDFDGDGTISSTPVAVDINRDGRLTTLAAMSDVRTLRLPATRIRRVVRSTPDELTAIPNKLTADLARELESASSSPQHQ